MTVQVTKPRSSNAELVEQCRLVGLSQPVPTILNAIPNLVLIVNAHREIVYANEQAIRSLNAGDVDEILGKRPGDAMHCDHAASCPGGCGTGEACRMCGAANAIFAAQSGRSETRECRILQHETGAAMDFRVSAIPLQIGGQTLTLVALTDISHENRRRSLERIFFHDLLNTLGALSGYAQLLESSRGDEVQEFGTAITRLAETMAEQINEQRDLAAAENNDLAIRATTINARELLEQIAVYYRNHPAGRDRKITVGTPSEPAMLRTDRRLLQRIIANMLKNALEAISAGEEVTLRCFASDEHVVFEVHNPGAIPHDVQLQIFQRAFSTKGVGRGLGTYSMKLLGERYLRGAVSFSSAAAKGTTFLIELPKTMAS